MEGTKMPLTKALLNVIYATGEIAVDFYYITHDAKYHRGAFMRGGHEYVEELKRLRNKKIRINTIKQLSRSKYIEIKKINDKIMIELTDKGKKTLFINKIKLIPYNKSVTTVVIFDIPENKKEIRQQFRFFLRQVECIKLQQSVWCSHKDIYKEMKEFVYQTHIEKWVNVFYGSNFLIQPEK